MVSNDLHDVPFPSSPPVWEVTEDTCSFASSLVPGTEKMLSTCLLNTEQNAGFNQLTEGKCDIFADQQFITGVPQGFLKYAIPNI